MRRRGVVRAIGIGVVVAVMSLATVASPARAAVAVDRSAILKVGINFADKATFPLDPAFYSANRATFGVMAAIYDTMLRRDPVTEKLSPGLATAWDAPDPLTVNLTLRQGVKFHDGTPLNADAVKFSIERQLAAVKARTAITSDAAFLALSSVDVVDPYKVRIRLTAPVTGLWIDELLTEGYYVSIISPTAVAKYGDDYKNHPVGAGPFVFQSYEPLQKLSLRKSPDYWDKTTYRYGGIDFIHTTQGTNTVTALRSGRIDVGVLDTASTASLKNVPGFAVKSQAAHAAWELLLPLCVAPFNNPNVRRAIAIGIDREEFAAGIGSGAPTALPYPATSKYYDAKTAKSVAYNPTKAKALLAGQGPFAPVTLMANAGTEAVQAATILKAQLERLGLTVTIFETTNSPTDLARLKPAYTNATATNRLAAFLLPGGGANLHCNYDSPAATAAWNSGFRDASLSEEQRIKAIRQAMQIWTAEGPMVWLASVNYHAGYTTALKGVKRLNVDDQAGVKLDTVYKLKHR